MPGYEVALWNGIVMPALDVVAYMIFVVHKKIAKPLSLASSNGINVARQPCRNTSTTITTRKH